MIVSSGDQILVDRGVEHGVPLGSIYCALVLVKTIERVRDRLSAHDIPLFDAWFLDDGQLVCRPSDVEFIFKTLYTEASLDGAARATGEQAKSVARIVGSSILAGIVAIRGGWQW